MHEDVTPPDADSEHHDRRYRTVEFDDGALIFDREDTAGWIYADLVVSLDATR